MLEDDTVSQRGSNITAERLRFDFSFPRKVTPEELRRVEAFVNEAIAADVPVQWRGDDRGAGQGRRGDRPV